MEDALEGLADVSRRQFQLGEVVLPAVHGKYSQIILRRNDDDDDDLLDAFVLRAWLQKQLELRRYVDCSPEDSVA